MTIAPQSQILLGRPYPGIGLHPPPKGILLVAAAALCIGSVYIRLARHSAGKTKYEAENLDGDQLQVLDEESDILHIQGNQATDRLFSSTRIMGPR